MSGYDLIVRDARLPRPDGTATPCHVGINAGCIAELDAGAADRCATSVDAAGAFMLPGLIETAGTGASPGRAAESDFAVLTRGALARGILTTFDTPLNAAPPLCDRRAFAARVETLRGRAYTDFGLWGLLAPGARDAIAPLLDAGVMGFKASLCAGGLARVPPVSPDELLAGMRLIAPSGLRTAVQVECPSRLGLGARAETPARAPHRPAEAAFEALDAAIACAAEARCRLHIVHIGSPAGIARVMEARARGLDVTAATSIYSLLQPDRGEASPDMCACLRRGEIDWIDADNVLPSTATAPDAHAANAGHDLGNIPSPLRLLLAANVAPLHQLVSLMSEGPARAFNLPGAGRLRPGGDASFILFDPDPMTPPGDQDHLYRSGPAYSRWPLKGRINRVYLRGRLVCRNGTAVGAPRGRLVTQAE